nr:MAG TPA: hypothetical protein [Caudoviricetes sp.]DAT83348.1 MAG TPA: hypothetical protein [Caudoviricetes sp.]
MTILIKNKEYLYKIKSSIIIENILIYKGIL